MFAPDMSRCVLGCSSRNTYRTDDSHLTQNDLLRRQLVPSLSGETANSKILRQINFCRVLGNRCGKLCQQEGALMFGQGRSQGGGHWGYAPSLMIKGGQHVFCPPPPLFGYPMASLSSAAKKVNFKLKKGQQKRLKRNQKMSIVKKGRNVDKESHTRLDMLTPPL